MSCHQDTGVSARFPCLAIGARGRDPFPCQGCQLASANFAIEAPKYFSVDLSDISGLASEELITGSDCLPFLTIIPLSQSYSRPSLSVISTISAAWLDAVA